MTLALVILAVLVVSFAVTYLTFLLAIKLIKIELTKQQLLYSLGIVLLFDTALLLLMNISNSDLLSGLLLVASWAGAIFIWHKVVNKYARSSVGRSVISYLIGSIVASFIIAFIAVATLGFVQNFQVSGEVMQPTYRNGTRILVNKVDRSPEVGSVVIYKYENNKMTVGRVKGVPSQSIAVDHSPLIKNGVPLESTTYRLNQNEYYVVPDNKAYPARIVSEDNIVGRVGPTLLK